MRVWGGRGQLRAQPSIHTDWLCGRAAAAPLAGLAAGLGPHLTQSHKHRDANDPLVPVLAKAGRKRPPAARCHAPWRWAWRGWRVRTRGRKKFKRLAAKLLAAFLSRTLISDGKSRGKINRNVGQSSLSAVVREANSY